MNRFETLKWPDWVEHDIQNWQVISHNENWTTGFDLEIIPSDSPKSDRTTRLLVSTMLANGSGYGKRNTIITRGQQGWYWLFTQRARSSMEGVECTKCAVLGSDEWRNCQERLTPKFSVGQVVGMWEIKELKGNTLGVIPHKGDPNTVWIPATYSLWEF